MLEAYGWNDEQKLAPLLAAQDVYDEIWQMYDRQRRRLWLDSPLSGNSRAAGQKRSRPPCDPFRFVRLGGYRRRASRFGRLRELKQQAASAADAALQVVCASSANGC